MKLFRAVKKDAKRIINKFKPSANMHKPEGYYFAPSAFAAYGWGKSLFGVGEFDIYAVGVPDDLEVIYALNGVPSGIGEARSCKYKVIKLEELTKEEKLGIGRTDWEGSPYTTIFLPEVILRKLPGILVTEKIDYDYGRFQAELFNLKREYNIG